MPLSRDEEKQIIREIQEAKSKMDSNWKKLEDAYRRPVYQCARVFARTDDDAHEIAQNAWIRFWKYVDRFDPDRSSILGFLRMLVRKAGADQYPPGGPHIEGLDEEGEDGEPRKSEPVSETVSPETLAELRELQLLILKLMVQLDNPMHQKMAFGFLRFLEWDSEAIVTRWSPETLDQIEKAFEDGYPVTPCASTLAAFAGLRKALNAPVRWEHVTANRAGDTLFKIYFTVVALVQKKQKVQGWADTIRRGIVCRLAIILPDERIQKRGGK